MTELRFTRSSSSAAFLEGHHSPPHPLRQFASARKWGHEIKASHQDRLTQKAKGIWFVLLGRSVRGLSCLRPGDWGGQSGDRRSSSPVILNGGIFLSEQNMRNHPKLL